MKGIFATIAIILTILTFSACALAPVTGEKIEQTKQMQFADGYTITVPIDVPDMKGWDYQLLPLYKKGNDFSLVVAIVKNPREPDLEGMIVFVFEKEIVAAIVIGMVNFKDGKATYERYWYDESYFKTGIPSGKFMAIATMPDIELLIKTKTKKEL